MCNWEASLYLLRNWSDLVTTEVSSMKATCKEHATHNHTHSLQCGHMAVTHDGHTDYLHDGHLHHIHNDHIDEHSVSVGNLNPNTCTPDHDCMSHDHGHTHSPTCGHERVPHGDHV